MFLAVVGLFTQTVQFLELQGSEDNNNTIDATLANNVDAIIDRRLCLSVGLHLHRADKPRVLHLKEALLLVHFTWYILGLPAVYLLLMIYSATNLNNKKLGDKGGDISEETLRRREG